MIVIAPVESHILKKLLWQKSKDKLLVQVRSFSRIKNELPKSKQNSQWQHLMVFPKVTDGLKEGTTIPRAPAEPANTNPTHPTKQSPTVFYFKQDSERRGQRDWVGEDGGAAERA